MSSYYYRPLPNNILIVLIRNFHWAYAQSTVLFINIGSITVAFLPYTSLAYHPWEFLRIFAKKYWLTLPLAGKKQSNLNATQIQQDDPMTTVNTMLCLDNGLRYPNIAYAFITYCKHQSPFTPAVCRWCAKPPRARAPDPSILQLQDERRKWTHVWTCLHLIGIQLCKESLFSLH